MMGQASGLFVLWMVLHFIFGALFLFGFIASLLYLSKHASKKDFKSIIWTTLLIGLFGSLLTCALLSTSVNWDDWNGPMMDWGNDNGGADSDL